MRLLPYVNGFALLTTVALAQPAPDAGPGPGPGYDPGQQQGAPGPGPAPGYDPGQPQGGPPPGYAPGPQGEGQGAMPPQGGARHPHGAFKQRFEAANVTHDGRLTLDQARQGHIGMVVRNFDQIDADHKGYVTIQDVHAWHRARHQSQGAQQQPAPMQ